MILWGCMASGVVGNLVFIENALNKINYLNILKNNFWLLNWVYRDLGLFQQVNVPKHTANVVQEWLPYHTPKVLDHRPQSPDLNPIEHLWEHLGRQVRKRTIRNKDML